MKLFFYFVLIPALLPVALILYYVYKKDKVEREPLHAIMITLAMGAFFALPCAKIESIFIELINAKFGATVSVEHAIARNLIGVAFVEELSKFLVFMIYVWKLRDFDYRYDGVVYAVCASMGFAGIENVLYVLNYGMGVSIGRAIFSIPGHASFAVFMGFFLARAKDWEIKNNNFMKLISLIFAIFVPVFIHGIYDFLLSQEAIEAGLNTYFIGFVVIIDIFAWLVIHHEFRTDRPLGYRK